MHIFQGALCGTRAGFEGSLSATAIVAWGIRSECAMLFRLLLNMSVGDKHCQKAPSLSCTAEALVEVLRALRAECLNHCRARTQTQSSASFVEVGGVEACRGVTDAKKGLKSVGPACILTNARVDY